MAFVPIGFLLIACIAGSLCLADLPLLASSVAKELGASCLGFAAIVALAFRTFLVRDPHKPEGG